MRIEESRKDFPITNDLIYLDSAATSLTPIQVVNEMNDYDLRYRANIGRGVHRLSVVATERYKNAHDKIKTFIGGDGGTLAVTKNTTEAIGMVAGGIRWESGDRVVATVLEHHSNFLPWLRLREYGVKIDIVRPDSDGYLNPDSFESVISDKTRLAAITHASNVLGNITPVKEIADICHQHDALLLVDGAQSVPHIPVDVSDIGCDYFSFSGHKMLGPTGTGGLWMRRPDLKPLHIGGGSIESATAENFTAASGEEKYEAGTPPVGGTIGLGRAVDYLNDIGMDTIRRHEERLTGRIIDGLSAIDHVKIVGPYFDERRIGVVSFVMDGMHPHEVAHILDEASAIMVRSGEHCCMPLMQHLGLESGTVRVSTYLYNNPEEVDMLTATIEEISRKVS
ncbi:aminotransferase class V-fold PLP-dependent enzyme [Methanoplanus limicola]|uniref:cysteine desulfurase n=1 Tax=Methanoplanus limicola DSM 2279 TaxID=937775 RepID=H1Z368_9EURY|nr:cysteine desulfurase [Methanoplanus limicola]EHQ36483.1 aminotransferase class V [Methanoplanus limicola DSM 2279]